ncbi:protein jim lovell-like isoform X5 [Cloeon dipterum]|uniref:protein jim lovell-like isoform X5 n=1 Tax=Cloeon dipterum TaxID=197152 RepID=UPI0032207C31
MAEGQLYSLKWNNYVDHIRTTFASLRVDRDLIDVTLSCEGKRITAHKMLLSACSPYFKSIFKENPCQHPVIVFRNIAFDDLAALIEFIYNGEVGVAEENLASFLNTAELLEVQGLTKSGQPAKKRNLETSPEEIKTASTSILSVSLEPELPLEANPLLTSIPNISPESAAPLVSKRRRRVSPPRKEDAAPNVSAVPVDEPVIEPFSDLPLKTEAVDEEVSITSDHGQYVAEDDDMAQGDAYEGADESHELEQNDGQDGDQSAQEKANGSSGIEKRRLIRGTGDGGFQCTTCLFKCISYYECKNHSAKHYEESTCTICNKTLFTKSSLSKHMMDCHNSFTCKLCRATFITNEGFLRHFDRNHSCG